MLGEEVADPLGIEGERAAEGGLGFLPLRTALTAKKTTRRVAVQWSSGSKEGTFEGYEIHAGQTQASEGVTPCFSARPLEGTEWRADGAMSQDGRVWGTYVHGLFENGSFVQEWLTRVGADRNLAIQAGWQAWQSERDLQLDRLAETLARELDMTALWALVDVRASAAECP